MMYFAFIYFGIGVLFALYILCAHMRACFEYIRQLYTSKNVRPSDIQTYFGVQYWQWPNSNSDPYGEVIIMTTLPAIGYMLASVFAWPLGSFILLNKSIKRARERIENDE